MLIDTHCHLDFDYFSGELDQFITRAQELGVEKFITISTKVKEFDKILQISRDFSSVFCSVGTHPNNGAEEPDISVEKLVSLTQDPKVVAIGEAGLDYHYDYSPVDLQKRVFMRHIEAARLTQLPLVIHTRDADSDMESILQKEMRKGAFPFILHCYSSGQRLADAAVELGGHISFSGILTFKNAEPIRQIAKTVPLDRLLVETDAPYLAPVPYRGKKNEPSFIVKTAACLAETLDMPFEDLAKITTENAFQLFKKMR